MALPQRPPEPLGTAPEPRFRHRPLGRDLAEPPRDPRGPGTAHGPRHLVSRCHRRTTTASAIWWRCWARTRIGCVTCGRPVGRWSSAMVGARPCVSRRSIPERGRRSCADTWTVPPELGPTSRSIAVRPWRSSSRSRRRFLSSVFPLRRQRTVLQVAARYKGGGREETTDRHGGAGGVPERARRGVRRRQRVERLWSRAQGDATTDDAGVRDGRS